MKKKLLLIINLILCALLICSCASGVNSTKYGEDNENPYYDLNESIASEDVSDTESPELSLENIVQNSNEKLVYTADYYITTKNYDDDYSKIASETAKYNGYIASEESYGTQAEQYGDSGRYSEITVKIPIDNYSTFTSGLSGIGTIVNKRQSVDNITQQYIDIESRIDLLETRYKKLEEHFKSATEMNDIIALESEMSEVLYELESLKGEKRGYDNLITYCTINITLEEVVGSANIPVSKDNFFDKAGEGFLTTLAGVGSFFEGIGVFLVSALPVLIILAIIAAAVLIIIKLIKKRKIKKSALKQSSREKNLIDIAKIEKTSEGILRIYPNNKTFPLIYLSAMAVYWDEENNCIYHIKCEGWSPEQWYTKMLRAVLKKYDNKLLISPETKWEGLNESERSRIIGAEQYVYSSK